MENYIMYLRKSQLDRDFESSTVQDTLNRHRSILTDFAQNQHLNVTEVLEEVVSGESLSSRPQMIKCLDLINTGKFAGVLCMDIDRLSRGSGVDSGYIMQVFQINNCLIVTPSKTYDLSNDSDEQFTDMKFLFSRYELKTITKRLVRGRKQSASEGKYMGSVAPYGYDIIKLQGEKGNSLVINESEAEVVKLIFKMYIEGTGYNTIAYNLNQLGIRSRSGSWGQTTIFNILNNEVYIGKIRWGKDPVSRTIIDGQLKKIRSQSSDYLLYDGRHESIITQDDWDAVKRIQAVRHPPISIKKEPSNPFAGLMVCAKCGSRVHKNVPDQKHKNTYKPWYRCAKKNKDCDCKIMPCDVVESAVVDEMKQWLDGYILELKDEPEESDYSVSISILEKQITDLQVQQQKICELLEKGVYSIDLFQTRNSALQEQLSSAQDKLATLQKSAEEPQKNTLIPTTQKLLDNYENMTPKEKNLLWKQVLEKIELYRSPDDELLIQIYPRLPQK